jgi:hypothetical protein
VRGKEAARGWHPNEPHALDLRSVLGGQSKPEEDMSIEAMKQAQAAIKSALDFYAAMFGVPVDSMLVTHHSEAKALFVTCTAAMETLSTAIEQAGAATVTKDEALKLALEALESCGVGHITDGGRQWHDEKLVDKAITAIKQARSAPVQEPDHGDELTIAYMSGVQRGKELAAQRQWVGLTDEEIEQCMKQAYATVQGRQLEHAFARATETAHNIKENT